MVAYLVAVEGGSLVRIEPDAVETQLQGIAFDETRRFSVRAVDEAGNESGPLSTSDALAPYFPEGARVRVERDGDAYVLRWPEAQDDVGVTGYAITRGDDEIASLDANARSYRVGDTNDGDDFEVAALDAAGHTGCIASGPPPGANVVAVWSRLRRPVSNRFRLVR